MDESNMNPHPSEQLEQDSSATEVRSPENTSTRADRTDFVPKIIESRTGFWSIMILAFLVGWAGFAGLSGQLAQQRSCQEESKQIKMIQPTTSDSSVMRNPIADNPSSKRTEESIAHTVTTPNPVLDTDRPPARRDEVESTPGTSDSARLVFRKVQDTLGKLDDNRTRARSGF
jgi:hypothetical protein